MSRKFAKSRNVALFNANSLNMYEVPDKSVQCVVTSPPYWGLRKYEGEQEMVWDGDSECEHEWGQSQIKTIAISDKRETMHTERDLLMNGTQVTLGQFCTKCGAWHGAFGLEPTPEMYVEHTIAFLREIRRVLRKDGVCFYNLGDSYAANWRGGGINSASKKQQSNAGTLPFMAQQTKHPYKPKDLCLIPFRVAIAAQQDGWWIRSVIIWHKPNAMPESVKDRPTNTHEYILMLTKNKKYYWDNESVRENENKRNLRTIWTFPTQPCPEAHFAVFPEELPKHCIRAATKKGDIILDPFAGTGTTMKVAKDLGRRAIGYEVSGQYCQVIVKKCFNE